MNRFTVTVTGGNIPTDAPKLLGFSISREAAAAMLVATTLGFVATSKENSAGRTAANSAALKGIRELYNADIYKKALAIANEQGLEHVPDFMGQYFTPKVRDDEIAGLRAIVAEDLKPKPVTPRVRKPAGTGNVEQGGTPTPQEQAATPGATSPMATPANQ